MFDLSIEEKGSKESASLLKELQKIASAYSGVSLTARARKDGGDKSNAYILTEGLPYHGRDFVTLDAELARKIEEAFAAKAQEAADEMARGVSKGVDPGRADTQRAAKIWTEAMRAYMDGVVERIEQGRVAGGDAVKALSEKYAAHKEKKFGFVEPVGKASGQLLDNLSTDGSWQRNIRLKK